MACPTGKVQMDRATAEKARKRGARQDRAVQIYRCPECHSWHVGNRGRPNGKPKPLPTHQDTEDEDDMNAINTTMADALTKAGVPVKSLRERIWQVIRDTGPTTAKNVAARLGCDEGRAARECSMLAHLGTLEKRRHATDKRLRSYVATADTYEDARLYGRKATPVTSIAPAAPPVAPPTTHSGLGQLPRELDGYTIGQLRALRDTLNALFS